MSLKTPSIHDLITKKGPSVRHSSSLVFSAPPKKSPKSTSRPSSARSKRSSVAITEPAVEVKHFEDAHLEDQYIKNLQQQVQFLELELELQKKVNLESKEKMMEEAKPLEDSLHNLKLNFIQKEQKVEYQLKEYKEKIEYLAKKYEEKESEVEGLRDELKHTKSFHDQQIMKVTEDYVQKLVASEKEAKRLKSDLEREREVVQKEIRDRLQKSNDKIAELQKTLQEKANKISDIEGLLSNVTKTAELWQQRNSENVDKLSKLETSVKTEKDTLANAERMYEELLQESKQQKLLTKQLEFDKEQLLLHKDKTDKQIRVMLEKQVEYDTNIDKLRHRLNATENQRDKLQKQCNDLQKQVESYKISERESTDQKNIAAKKLTEVRDKLSIAQRDLLELQGKYNNTQHDRDDLERDYKHSRKQIETLNGENEELTTQHQLLSDRFQQFKLKDDRRQEMYDQLFEQYNKLKITNKRYRRQLKLSGLVGGLFGNVDLQTVANTNMNMATKINDLINTLREEDLDADDGEDPLDTPTLTTPTSTTTTTTNSFKPSQSVTKSDTISTSSSKPSTPQMTTPPSDLNVNISLAALTAPTHKRKTFDEWFADKKK